MNTQERVNVLSFEAPLACFYWGQFMKSADMQSLRDKKDNALI